MTTVRPSKRRRTGHRLPPIVDGSDMSMDTAMYVQGEGGERVLVSVRPDPVAQDNAPNEAEAEPEPEPEPERDFLHEFTDMPMNLVDRVAASKKNRWFYMKEFAERVDGILEALQAQEALPNSARCAECGKSYAPWRCEDCIGGKHLCRVCMRHSHFSNPFHRIECWTGTYFRKAALWEVGVYLLLPHQSGGTCQNLLWQKQLLEKLQTKKDEVIIHTYEPIGMDYNPDPEQEQIADPEPDPEMEASVDEAEMHFLDQLLAGQNPDEIMEEDDTELADTEGDIQDMDAGTAGFTDYINHRLGTDSDDIPDAPNCDALSNQYVRVVHTSGIHHIALVACTCQGHEKITTNLIYAGWVPTSFVRVRTIFTTALLDHFRYCNLEMRSSAYQFFQLLRRMTNSLAPSKVVNLYHELRRLSRLWRWVKKLRWAGYGQRVDSQ